MLLYNQDPTQLAGISLSRFSFICIKGRIKIQKAVISDAEKLTEIMKKTFDEEARRWILNQEILDYNIQPPGYSSVEKV
ncbi:hypothetical protein PAJ34TS1_26710 [Paenibacillus azoreducens]|uniref:Uncharacterized protein n=1 Tax=Paenibacillus azoreducens TaxID=116718 RepID=A0A920CMG2_9BACL|nr:hypothetical protein J34TS1_10210 [Paenibacillus azoreducens]